MTDQADIDLLAQNSLCLWDLPPQAHVRLINVSENATYLVEAPNGFKAVLRVHRQGYHTRRAIACELAWAGALQNEGIIETPIPIRGRDGSEIQSVPCPIEGAARHMVMFNFVSGSEPAPDDNLVALFTQLGEIAARTHLHSMAWQRPDPFERLVWDENAVFGASPTWGDWRDGPNVTDHARGVLNRTQSVLMARLAAYGKGHARYGLIHADMRLANLLIDKDQTTVIDFDDCGFGWFLYDFASAISFMEDHPQVPDLKCAWLLGYRRVRPLSDQDAAEIDSFVILRRLALLGWMGTHTEVPVVQDMSTDFCANTVALAERYLAKMSATG